MISIVIPAYNSSATIVEALESVSAQTLWADTGVLVTGYSLLGNETNNLQPITNNTTITYEVIVVDDCSTDDTVEVVEKWVAGKDSSLSVIGNTDNRQPITNNQSCAGWRILHQPRNAGPAAARNAGIAAAHGDWIAFLDADDLWLPNHLESLMTAAGQTGAVMVCGESVRFQASAAVPQEPVSVNGYSLLVTKTNNQEPITDNAPQAIPLEELARHNPIATSTVLVRREAVLAAGGFDEQFRGPEDYDLWIRVAAFRAEPQLSVNRYSLSVSKTNNQEPITDNSAAVNIMHINLPVSGYRQVAGSLSMDERKFLPQVLRVIEKAYGPGGALAGLFQWKNAALATQYQQASWMAFCRGARSTALRHWMTAIIHNAAGPKRIKKPWLKLAYRYVLGRRPA